MNVEWKISKVFVPKYSPCLLSCQSGPGPGARPGTITVAWRRLGRIPCVSPLFTPDMDNPENNSFDQDDIISPNLSPVLQELAMVTEKVNVGHFT